MEAKENADTSAVDDYRRYIKEIADRCEDLATLKRVFNILDRAVYSA